MNKKGTLSKQQLQLLCDLVQNALEDNLNSKSSVKNQQWNDDLTEVRNVLWDMED